MVLANCENFKSIFIKILVVACSAYVGCVKESSELTYSEMYRKDGIKAIESTNFPEYQPASIEIY